MKIFPKVDTDRVRFEASKILHSFRASWPNIFKGEKPPLVQLEFHLQMKVILDFFDFSKIYGLLKDGLYVFLR